MTNKPVNEEALIILDEIARKKKKLKRRKKPAEKVIEIEEGDLDPYVPPTTTT